MSYHIDLRERVVKFVVEYGNSRQLASETFQVHYNTVKNWVKIWKEKGNLSPKPIPPKRPYKLDWCALRQQVLENPERFQYDHAQSFDVSQSAISKALSKMGITVKKKTFRYQEQDEDQVQTFTQALEQVTGAQCVYIDECGIKPNLIREFGWAPRGEPVLGHRMGKRERKLNLIAALNEQTLKAPFIYEGVMNSDLFNTYLEEFLLPTLTEGQIVIMDNAPFHQSLETRRLIEEKGCQLWFLPAYSPELNPIEKIWAVLKRYVRRFRANFESLTQTIDFIFQQIKPFHSS